MDIFKAITFILIYVIQAFVWVKIGELKYKERKSKIASEDVKRWFQILVGKGEKAMEEDIKKTFKL